MNSETCEYADCGEPSEVTRRHIGDEEKHSYCGDHDPLEDETVADYWEEI